MTLELPTGRMAWRVDEGDTLELLAQLPPASIDAMLDDPPAGISFMGRAWDDKRGYTPVTQRGREVNARFCNDITRRLRELLTGIGLSSATAGLPDAQAEALELAGMLGDGAPLLQAWGVGFLVFMVDVATLKLRAAKPGAHSLSWALPRTSDLTMMAMRLAGWEIRDSLVHLFGGGFPKSLDVGKAIDKAAGAQREVVGSKVYGDGHVQNSSESIGFGGSDPAADMRDITAPTTDAAKQWDGWGTALSPGHECWILARKPLTGTVAANVQRWGVGGLNIDGCRTAGEGAGTRCTSRDPDGACLGHSNTSMRPTFHGPDTSPSGRWPKNAVLSCALACTPEQHTPWCPSEELGRQSGTLTSGKLEPHHQINSSENLAMSGPNQERHPRQTFGGDSGTAARFFPRFGPHAPGCPVGELDSQSGVSPSNWRAEKGRGLNGSPAYGEGSAEPMGEGGHADTGGASRYFPTFHYCPKASDRTVHGRPELTNKHPTHKHPDLMRWLIRLICPPGGLVLDCFGGSGTTGVAAQAEGVRCLLFERDPEHVEVARARIGSPVQVGLFA